MTDPYTSGPFESTTGSALGGWQTLNRIEIEAMIYFMRNCSELQSVMQVCYNNLISGPIHIDSMRSVKAAKGANPPMIERENQSDSLQPKCESEEAEHAQRSDMWGRFGYEVALIQNAIGFVPVTDVPNTLYPGIVHTDPLRPVVLNLSKVIIRFKKDVFNTPMWEFYEVMDPFSGEAFESNTIFAGTRLMQGIKVLGYELPDDMGNITSRVKRIHNGSYVQYQSKAKLTVIADKVRAKPTVVTRELDSNSHGGGANAVRSSASPEFDHHQLDADQLERIQSVHALTLSANTNCAASEMGTGTRKRRREGEGALVQLEVDAGRDVATQQMVEAPADMLSTRQAFIEDVCLTFSVPMAMLSSGDASGKAKLNSASAGNAQNQIFQDAQAERKRELEGTIRRMYEWIYMEKRVWDQIKTTTEAAGHEWDSQDGDPDKRDAHIAKAVAKLKTQDLTRFARVAVRIPCNPDWAEWKELHECGYLRYSSFVNVACNKFGLSTEDFHEKPLIAIEDIIGVAPLQPVPPPPAAAASKKAKTKK